MIYVVLLASILLLDAINERAAALAIPSNVRFRRGGRDDDFAIATTMALSLMNPLSIDGRRFVVAENADDGYRVGWAQLKPLGPATVDPNRIDAARGSGDVEREADEEMWQLFEEEEEEFPSGLKSLPWTEEYRAAAKAAEERRNKRAAILARERASAGQLWELSSVYVSPRFRGRGVGSALVRRIMAMHEELGREASDVYALTLATTVDWYRDLGFDITDEPPAAMEFEVAAGRVITKLIGEDLVCIRGGAS